MATIPCNSKSTRITSNKLGKLLAPWLKGKPKVKSSLQESFTII